jgi:hypothetical protein
MKAFLKIITSLLLLINGIGAIYGGGNLILHPDGSSIQLSPHWLQHTPFHDYLIPGIILFIANGLLSMFVFIALLLKHKNYPWLVTAQGAILTGWIVIQILLIQTIYFLHIILGSFGIALIVLGILELRLERKQQHHEGF